MALGSGNACITLPVLPSRLRPSHLHWQQLFSAAPSAAAPSAAAPLVAQAFASNVSKCWPSMPVSAEHALARLPGRSEDVATCEDGLQNCGDSDTMANSSETDTLLDGSGSASPSHSSQSHGVPTGASPVTASPSHESRGDSDDATPADDLTQTSGPEEAISASFKDLDVAGRLMAHGETWLGLGLGLWIGLGLGLGLWIGLGLG